MRNGPLKTSNRLRVSTVALVAEGLVTRIVEFVPIALCGSPYISCTRVIACLSHMPAMAHADRLAGERVGLRACEEQGDVGDVLYGGEALIPRLGEHDRLDDARLADTELLGLLGDLLFDKWRLDEARADDIGAHIMRSTLFGDHPGESEQAMLGSNISRLQRRPLVAVHRSHIEEHA